MFKELPDKLSLAELEKKVLSFWSENNTFEMSIKCREGSPHFSFYEGPPTANGKPGIHHVMSRTLKDLVCRYKTLRGFQVFRKAGWDTQGLPVEIEVEKSLGISSKDDIEKIGVAAFNKKCRESVFLYLKDWEYLTERMGYWVNLKDAYITYTKEYIESVWWSLKKFFDAGLIYRGFKIQPYCPRCETPLSSHEVAQGYEDVKDPSVYVVFRIKDGQGLDGYQFLVWTTTPWTLISNVALSVGPDIDYVKIRLKDTGDRLILAKERLPVVVHEYELEGEIKGRELEGLEYEQLLKYVKPDKKAFFVAPGDFVTTVDGSGIVHIAPAFGEDDYQLSRKFNLPVVQPVDKSGKFTEEVEDFKGRFVKEADEDIIKKLKSEGKLYRKEKYTHSYPHCWRCHTPLLYYARESWYINTSSYKDKMIRVNEKINWYPPETGTGRFGNWLEENRDWALSRDRYWGTPLPVWACSCEGCENKYTAVGSVEELRSRSLNFDEVFPTEESVDLHKPFIDRVKLKCSSCGCEMNRVEEVIDAWYDSGSMPFAQHHYPFQNKELFENNYPADFIAEGIDQTRGWFYTLHAIGTFLFDDRAYKNILVNDMVLDSDAQKMSKHKGNVVDPIDIIDRFGADVLRWYLVYSSPPWRPKMFNEDDLIEVRNKFFDTLINTYRFFVLYSNLKDVSRAELTAKRIAFSDKPEIDRWLISSLNTLKKKYIALMDGYDLTRAARMLHDFTLDDLSNWYVRRNRKRFRNPENDKDRLSAFQTLYEVLAELVKMISPISPFLADELYQNLTGQGSVHLSLLEKANENETDPELENEMHTAQRVVSLVRALRVKHNLRTRQPLRQVLIPALNPSEVRTLEKMKKIIIEEVNVKELNFVKEESGIIKKKAKPNFKVIGPKFSTDIKLIAEAIRNLSHADVNKIESEGSLTIKTGGKDFTVASEDIEVQTENIEGWVVESSNELTVALDTKLDAELIEEGIAREFINRIQNIRKDMALDVNDRIKVRYKGEEELFKAILKQKKYIEKETLAVELKNAESDKPNGFVEANINGRDFKLSVEKI